MGKKQGVLRLLRIRANGRLVAGPQDDGLLILTCELA
jgi:hypothetical protein